MNANPTKRRPIRGAGGKGGGGGGGLSEQADTLKSRAYARVVDLISEGEIEGLVDGAKSIYLDGVPLQNADGIYNFSGVTVNYRNGTQGQSYIEGFEAVESELTVGVEVTTAISVTRSITDEDIDAVRVTIGIPALYRTTDEGEVRGHNVNYAIDVQYDGGGYNEVVNRTITGKASSRYQRAHRIDLDGDFPVDIRVRRITSDESGAVIQNKTYWDSYTEIIDAKLRYPNSALVATSIDSAQFRNIPTRGYHIKGIRLQVPSNYDAEARTYTGVWDGTFQTAYSNNPAWVFYDLLTTARYGLGLFVDADQVDKWGLYTIAQYCDELVPDGKGGSEPRFTCNTYIQTRYQAYTLLSNLASVFRGMAYWGAGTIVAAQDSPADPVHLYTAANVVDGMFNYAGSSLKARHTVALVKWNDPDDLFRERVEYVEDVEAIARYGVIQAEVQAIGCTSQGQAHRVGRWLLYSERYETETVTFRTGLEGAVGAPGQIIKVADPARAGVRFGGRIVTATTTAVTVDSAVTLEAGQTYTLSVMLEDGSVESAALLNGPGSATALNLASALSEAPLPGAIWVLASDEVEAQLFRVISVAEPERGVYEFTALKHYADKYDAIEQNLVVQEPEISTLRSVPDSPENLLLTETLYESGAAVLTQVSLSWTAVDRAMDYEVVYTVDDGNEVRARTTVATFDVLDAAAGIWNVRVRAFSTAGIPSVPAELTQTVLGKTAAPADVTGFAIANLNSTALLTWDKHPDLDVRVGGKILVKYSAMTTGATWSDGIDIADFPGEAVSGYAPLLSGTYMAKARDSSGNLSTGIVSIVTTETDVMQFNAVESATEGPTFGGTFDGTVYDGDLAGVKLNGAVNIDDYLDNIDDWDSFDLEGGLEESGYYYFAGSNQVDLGDVFTSRLTAAMSATAYDESDTIDARDDNIDDWADFDGADVTDANARLEVRTTEDDPGGAPVWSDWMPFFVGDYKARAFEFRLLLSRVEETHNIVVTGVTVTVDMPDRVEAGDDILSNVGGTAVTFAAPFREVPAIAVTGQDLATGDYWVISGKTTAGFSVIFRNSAAAGVARTFDWLAKGYGFQH